MVHLYARLREAVSGSGDLPGGFIEKIRYAQVTTRHIKVGIKGQRFLETRSRILMKPQEPANATVVPIERFAGGGGNREAVAVIKRHDVSRFRL
jgi:hypothetical protein